MAKPPILSQSIHSLPDSDSVGCRGKRHLRDEDYGGQDAISTVKYPLILAKLKQTRHNILKSQTISTKQRLSNKKSKIYLAFIK